MVVIVGRPNVGKSTLFNRLIGRRQAVVSPLRGTTRDRVAGSAQWRGVTLTLVDTGGMEFAKGDGLRGAVQRHIQRALEEADGVIFVCDAREGLVPADEMILARLRKMGKPIVLAANKADDRPIVPPEFFSLGLEHTYAVSALHGRGIGELLDALLGPGGRASPDPAAPDQRPPTRPAAPPPPTVAIIGRQNVGKSSLFNALLREERVIVSEEPGTTRDAVEASLSVNGKPVALIDTAGLRHRRKVKSPVDLFSMSRAIEAIGRCDVVMMVLDARSGVTRDDRRLITQVCEAGRGLVLLVNKWDLVRGGNPRALVESIHRAMPSASFAPVLAVSATTGFHVTQSLSAALRVVQGMRRGVSDEASLALLQRAWASHAPSRWRGRPLYLRRVRCVPGRPMRMELGLHPVGWLAHPYQQYLLKQLHAHPQLAGVPIRLELTRT